MERVTWLKDFSYEGQVVSGYSRYDEGAYGRLKGLEEIIKRRAKAEKGAPDKVERTSCCGRNQNSHKLN